MTIRAILIDAMGTIFTFKRGLDRYEMYAVLYEKHAGKTAPREAVKRVYDDVRERWEDRLPPHHSRKWAVITAKVFQELWPDVDPLYAEEIGRRCNAEFLSNAALYEVVPSTRTFLRSAASRHVRVILASNQDRGPLEQIVATFDLDQYLRGIYTSTEVGHEKPDPAFFSAVFEDEALQPTECVMIGNNPKNDVVGAGAVGMQGILYDAHDAHPSFCGYRVRQLHEIWSLDLFR